MIALKQRLGGGAGLDQEEIKSEALANSSCVCGTTRWTRPIGCGMYWAKAWKEGRG